MQFGIYKPGQGYWVRVLTAIGAAICFGAFALWAWQQAALIPIPTPQYDLALGQVDGTISAGDEVTLLRQGGQGGGARVEFGTAVVASVSEDASSVIVEEVNVFEAERDVSDTTSISLASGLTARVTNRIAIPIFERLYLQAAIAGVIILIGAFVTFYYVGANRKTTEFLIATDNEMKKVNWSTRKDIIGSTWVVIAAAFLMAAGLFAVDIGFSWFFKTIGVLTN